MHRSPGYGLAGHRSPAESPVAATGRPLRPRRSRARPMRRCNHRGHNAIRSHRQGASRDDRREAGGLAPRPGRPMDRRILGLGPEPGGLRLDDRDLARAAGGRVLGERLLEARCEGLAPRAGVLERRRPGPEGRERPGGCADGRGAGPSMARAEEPIGIPPGRDYFYIPGQNIPAGGGVAWRPGFWARSQAGWEWIPSRWERQADGWAFREGFWNRAPVRPVLLRRRPLPGAASLVSAPVGIGSPPARMIPGPVVPTECGGRPGSGNPRAAEPTRSGQIAGETRRRTAHRRIRATRRAWSPAGASPAAALRVVRSSAAEPPRAPPQSRNRGLAVGGFFRRRPPLRPGPPGVSWGSLPRCGACLADDRASVHPLPELRPHPADPAPGPRPGRTVPSLRPPVPGAGAGRLGPGALPERLLLPSVGDPGAGSSAPMPMSRARSRCRPRGKRASLSAAPRTERFQAFATACRRLVARLGERAGRLPPPTPGRWFVRLRNLGRWPRGRDDPGPAPGPGAMEWEPEQEAARGATDDSRSLLSTIREQAAEVSRLKQELRADLDEIERIRVQLRGAYPVAIDPNSRGAVERIQERDSLRVECERLRGEARALRSQLESRAAEAQERCDRLTEERDSARAERDRRQAEHAAIGRELEQTRELLGAGRDALAREVDQLRPGSGSSNGRKRRRRASTSGIARAGQALHDELEAGSDRQRRALIEAEDRLAQQQAGLEAERASWHRQFDEDARQRRAVATGGDHLGAATGRDQGGTG